MWSPRGKVLRLKTILIAGHILATFGLSGCATPYYHIKSETVQLFDKAKDLYDQGYYSLANDYFQRILNEHSDSVLVEPSLYYIAKCYEMQKKYEKAKAFYKGLIVKYPAGLWADFAKKDLEAIESR